MLGLEINQTIFIMLIGAIVVFAILLLAMAAYFDYRRFCYMRDYLQSRGYDDNAIERLSGVHGGIEFLYMEVKRKERKESI